MSDRILIVDDDRRLAERVATYLGDAGFEVVRRGDAAGGLQAIATAAFDAAILDVMLPDLDGFELCRRIRAKSDVPILMLTARGEETDRIVGLELGADDYLPKPFNPRELLARLRAILRRGRAGRGAAAGAEDVLRFGALELDRARHEARLRGERCALTAHQFALLRVLAERAGRVVGRDELMSAVRGDDGDAFDRSIDVHVSRIRAAIEDDPRAPRRLLTVRGAGYVLAREQD